MLFSSISFLYYFLPIFLLVYYLTPLKHRNIPILVFSFIFYFIGEPRYIFVLISSCLINYYLSKKIEKHEYSKNYLLLAIFYNVGQLLFFKYFDFFTYNINSLFNLNVSYLNISMPIGISFFTFQALGYILDVYYKKHAPARNLVEFMTYISLFPQLIAGPIVRYSDVCLELKNRETSTSKFSNGVRRFVLGLSKKVLLANVLGEFVKCLTEVTVLSSWLKPFAYTLQIYFDFSGYSDMAIGLGLMMGFTFLENFNYPFIANSITDFWRRWHISLSSWFRDYVYIPLGGNRVSKIKWFRNILIVWFLTGFWHGASWNFILWGLYFGIILIIEKVFLGKVLEKTRFIKYIYTVLIVVISFEIFQVPSLKILFDDLKNMFLINNIPFSGTQTVYYFKNYLCLFIVSLVASTPLIKNLVNYLNKTKLKSILAILEPFIYILLLLLCTAFLIDESFNPFLYFRF